MPQTTRNVNEKKTYTYNLLISKGHKKCHLKQSNTVMKIIKYSCSFKAFHQNNNLPLKILFKKTYRKQNWCQFQQHFKCNFFVQKCFAQLFFSYKGKT